MFISYPVHLQPSTQVYYYGMPTVFVVWGGGIQGYSISQAQEEKRVMGPHICSLKVESVTAAHAGCPSSLSTISSMCVFSSFPLHKYVNILYSVVCIWKRNALYSYIVFMVIQKRICCVLVPF